MYQPLGEDPQTEDSKPTPLGSWGSSELRYLLMVSQNCGNPVRDTETLPSCTKHATYKRDSEAGDTQDARACLCLMLSRQGYLDIHMLSWFLHGVWNYVRTSDRNHHVLNVLHWSHHHCTNFHTVVTKLCGSCLGMLWLQDKSWHGFSKLIPSADTSQSLSRVFEEMCLIPTPKLMRRATNIRSTSLLE